MTDNIYFHRYLQKARYKKHEKKADKSTNVFSVPKKGKNNAAVPTTTNNKAPSASNNVRGGSLVTFVIPKIEQPEEPSATTISTAANCKSFEPNNISSLVIHTGTYYILKNFILHMSYVHYV